MHHKLIINSVNGKIALLIQHIEGVLHFLAPLRLRPATDEGVLERRCGTVVGRLLCTRPTRVQSPGWEARIIRCKNLALYIGDCESLVTG